VNGYVRFELTPTGELEMQMVRGLAQAIDRYANELREVVEHGGSTSSDVHARLFPRAYVDPTEDRAELAWQLEAHGELVSRRLAQLELLTSTLDRGGVADPVRVVLSPEEVEAWLGVINDLRLALGVTLEITADTDLDAIPLHDPRRGSADLYEILGYVQATLLHALMGDDFEDLEDDE